MTETVLTAEAAPEPGPVEQSQAITETPAVVDTASANVAPDWRNALAEELRGNPSISAFKSVDDLATSFINTKKMVGTDKVSIPGKYATDEDWTETFQKLGLPSEIDGYELKTADEGGLDDELFKGFRETAFSQGILPKQAQSILDWFARESSTLEEQKTAMVQQKIDADIDGLRQEWGDAFDSKLVLAKAAVNHFGGPEMMQHLNDSGLGNDTAVIKLMSKVGESLSEAEFKGVEEAKSSMTPNDIAAEKRKIFEDPAYLDKQHPNHASIVQHMASLYKL